MPEAVETLTDSAPSAPPASVGSRLSTEAPQVRSGYRDSAQVVADDLREIDDAEARDDIENLDTPEDDTQPVARTAEKPDEAAPDDIEAKIASFGLNPKQHADILALLKENFAPKQAAQAETGPDVDQVMRDLATELSGKPAEEAKPAMATATASQTAPQQNQNVSGFGDGFDNFQSADDFYKARSEADISGDHRKVNDIDQAIFIRRLDHIMPKLQQIVGNWIEYGVKRLVPQNVLQEAEYAWEGRIENEAQEKAEKFLRSKLGEGFSAMLAEDGGKPVEWDGKQMSPVPYNRIVAQHPYIGKIRVDHKDPATAKALTWAERYGAAFRIWQQQQQQTQVTEKVAKEVAAANAKSGARAERDRQRSTVHSGGRTAGIANGSKESTPEDRRRFIGDNSPGSSVRLLRNL